ncbi:MAG TPA: SH3 domain-containing protein [Methylomirabilota bacterium]|nr:SH3 domain-containing protein [Methylomirabilota bacterium]
MTRTFATAAMGLALFIAAAVLPSTDALAIQEFTPEPGWRYRVVDVSQTDTLNVREQPGVDSAVVDTLPAVAADVVVTGERVEIDGSVWWRIVTENARGWVNARYLTPMAPEGEREAGYPLQCIGTEPFWFLTVGPDGANLSTPDDPDVRWSAGAIMASSGNPGHLAVRLEADGDVGHLAAMRSYDFCSDGMSDTQFPFEAIVIAPGGRVLSGCCSRGG